MKNVYRLLVAALLVCLPATAGAVIVRHDVSLEATEEAGKQFPATARFLPDGCGVLVAPDWLLTAAHVGRDIAPGQKVEVAGHRGVVARVVFHPKAEGPRGRPPEVDAALVQLVEPISDVVPAKVYTKDDEVGRVVTLAGFGDFGHAGDSKPTMQNGICRAVTNRIAHLHENFLALPFDKGDEATELEGVGGPGDSGGPLYIDADGEVFVAGISSFSKGRPVEYGSTDHYMRVSLVAAWIEETVTHAAPDLSPQSVLNALAGSWQGALEYLDYQTNDWTGIPLAVDVEVMPDGVTRTQRARFTDPGVLVHIINVSSLREDGSTMDVAVFRKGSEMVSYTESVRFDGEPQAIDRWTLVFEFEGQDDNRPAMIRETTTCDGASLITVKTVDFLDDEGEEWLTRNRVRLERTSE